MREKRERLDRDFLREEEILKLLETSQETLLRAIREKEFPHIKLGQKRLFYEPDVVAWLRLQRKGLKSEDEV